LLGYYHLLTILHEYLMEHLQSRISQLKAAFEQALSRAATEQSLEEVRLEFLSRKGSIASLMTEFKELPAEEKRIVGPLLNELKQYCEQTHKQRVDHLLIIEAERKVLKEQHFDVTASKSSRPLGRLHVYTKIIQELEDIFLSMGFTIADGPEVETDFYNFQALNIPEDHPARDMHDTFWISMPHILLRTHTSTIQIHAMQEHGAPLAVFAPGRCYRHEAVDASHDFVFTQAECIVVGKHISLANLLATAQTYVRRIFNKEDLAIRVRPGYFPFVEPGLEIDASCPFCTTGCSICKKTRWIELLGAGLIHPAVLRHCGIDPTVYTGFAFGGGIERLAMLRYGIDDIRLFHSTNIDFFDQF
jgi:phenylalanyl-tRNA synthetase alpha chain